MYGSPFRPQFRPKVAPRKVSPAAEDSLITIPGATAMSHAERDGVVPMGRVRVKCEDSEEKGLEQ